MNTVIFTVLAGLGWATGLVFGHPVYGALIGLVLAGLTVWQSHAPLDNAVRKTVIERTNSYLSEVWAIVPALKRIEAYDAEYAIANLKETFLLHFPQELQDEIHTSEEIFDLGKIIFQTEVKPLVQMKAFKRSNNGLFKKNGDAAATVLHAGRIYARAGATPAMLKWLEAWSRDMGINPDVAHRGYLDEVHLQDGTGNTRLIADNFEIDQRLDQIPEVLGEKGNGTTNEMISRNTLYAEYRKAVGRLRLRQAA